MATSFKLTFHGGAGSVTGANFLLEGLGVKLLIDCGLEQVCKSCEDTNREPFPYDPASIDALIVTHAHIDHIGRIPPLVRSGFRGVIYSTEATRELSEVMLVDSMRILNREAERNRLPSFYEQSDINAAMAKWRAVSYRTLTTLPGGLVFTLKDAGHILGSAIVEVTRMEGSKRGGTIVFSGDLGNSPTPLLQNTETITDADYVVMESVYGDRSHEAVLVRQARLRSVIEETIARKGVLLVPAFSLERTQIMLYEINNLVEEGKIPKVPVFLDSPLAISVTEIYRRYIQDMGAGVQKEIASGDDIFSFPGLIFTKSADESKAINEVRPPKIIIAGAGMSHGGRIQYHERRYLSDPSTTLLMVGYQVPGSVGRMLQDGAREVNIMGWKITVRATIVTISGYSAHRDMDGLMQFAEGFAEKARQIFVVMGEPKAALFLVQRLRDYCGLNAVAPEKGTSYTIRL